MQEGSKHGDSQVSDHPVGGSKVSDTQVVDTSGVGSSDNQDSAPPLAQDSLSFGQMFTSTLWAALGVQNKKNRERDFTRGRATHFIYFGIGFTVLFVLGMYTLVSFVLS